MDYQAIVNTKNKDRYNFFIQDNSVYYIINKKNNNKVKLMDNVKAFDVSLDKKNVIHMLYVTLNEELCYAYYSNSMWKKRTVLNKPDNLLIDYIKILNINNSLHIFYTYRNKTTHLFKLFHIHIYNNILKTYSLTPNNIFSNDNFFIDCDSNNNIILLYKTKSKNTSILNIKRFSSEQNNWSLNRSLNTIDKISNINSFYIDCEDNCHFTLMNNNYISMKLNTLISFDKFTPIEYLLSAVDENKNYKIFEAKNKLWITWIVNKHLYYISSNDKGTHWSNRQHIALDNVLSIKYIDFNMFKSINAYGFIMNSDIYLVGLDNNLFKINLRNGSTQPITNNILQSNDTEVSKNDESNNKEISKHDSTQDTTTSKYDESNNKDLSEHNESNGIEESDKVFMKKIKEFLGL